MKQGNMKSTGNWRNKPLFRRDGDARFKTGQEASSMLLQEVTRRDGHEMEFVDTVSTSLGHLGCVFDRSPRYAWIAKQVSAGSFHSHWDRIVSPPPA